VAAFPEDAHDTERLIKLADDAMYARKAETRRALLRAIETHHESESAISDSNTPARR
jgi:predicted signal transduction protein with EAL and GGDEF domain